MPQHMVSKAMLGGLLGTLGQILLVDGVAPLMAGHALELAALRGLPCALGLLMHLVSGSGLLPLGYLAVPPHDVPGSPVLKGMLWAGRLLGSRKVCWRRCWARRSSVRPWAASRPPCGPWRGPWSMAPRSAGSSVPQRPRTGRPHAPGEPAHGRQTQAARPDDRGVRDGDRVVRWGPPWISAPQGSLAHDGRGVVPVS